MSKPVKTPYCKVCHDAGKSESEYKSHWVKDLNGKTVCPTLLSLECRYCFKPGHTVKFCDVLLAKNKEVTKTAATKTAAAKAVHAAKKPATKKRFNCFEALDYDSDKEEEEKEEEKEAEPEVANTLTGWAAIAAKPKSVEQPKPNMIFLKRQPILTPKVVEPIKVETAQQTVELVKKPLVFTKRWADLSDSEDDDIESDVGNDAWD